MQPGSGSSAQALPLISVTPLTQTLQRYSSTLPTLYYSLPLFTNFYTSEDLEEQHYSENAINTAPALRTAGNFRLHHPSASIITAFY